MQIFSTCGTSTCSRRMMVCRGSLFFHEFTHWLEGVQRSGADRPPAEAAAEELVAVGLDGPCKPAEAPAWSRGIRWRLDKRS